MWLQVSETILGWQVIPWVAIKDNVEMAPSAEGGVLLYLLGGRKGELQNDKLILGPYHWLEVKTAVCTDN